MRLFPAAYALAFLAVLGASAPIAAAERGQTRIETLFPDLRALTTAGGAITLHYAPKLGQALTAEHPDARAHEQDGIGGVERPLRMRLNGDEQWFTIDCDLGPSADPSCSVFIESASGLKLVGGAEGERFVFPGNGTIYVDGRSNRMYDTRRKYAWNGSEFRPVAQPFYYVGLDSIALADLTLYDAKASGHVVARLPKGSRLTVLLNDIATDGESTYAGDHYLVKTPFGLVGWLNVPAGEAETVEGLRFYGD